MHVHKFESMFALGNAKLLQLPFSANNLLIQESISFLHSAKETNPLQTDKPPQLIYGQF